jgi:nicotinamidase-related amidase
MQKWMFRHPERAVQIPSLVDNIGTLTQAFTEAGLPIFNVQTIHKADRSTWSRLMLKHNYACLIEHTEDAELVEGYRAPQSAVQISKTANSAFVTPHFENALELAGVTELVLAGVFIDGCVGLTAADAAQRGFDVTFVEDAIGHTRLDRRTIIFDWLSADFDMKLLSTKRIVADVCG